jgi:peptidoglycan/xylan/chitin deacetylase (PgdA/CDA1 family)
MVKQLIKKGIARVDDGALALASDVAPTDTLVNVLFHSLYERRTDIPGSPLAPEQNVTVSDFRDFVERMLDLGYQVVSPNQIDAGLAPGGRYLSITFDDGYFNNTLALDVLAQFRVPATFFVSSDHVQQNKAFWWDAYSRELSRQCVSDRERRIRIEQLKAWGPERIELFLCQHFGAEVLTPLGDMDRPLNPQELRLFANHPWVHIGNHTRNHAILTNCTSDEVAAQICQGQQALHEMVGYQPVAIAYPNGNTSSAVVNAAATAGLRVGFTVSPQHASLPAAGIARMLMGRFFYEGGQDVRRQCHLLGARWVPSRWLKRLRAAW